MRLGPTIEKFVRRRLPVLYNPLLSIYQRLFDKDTLVLRRALRNEISRLDSIKRPLVFVQVGSNDGFSNDPFCEWVLSTDTDAYFFEPVPMVYSRLVENYTSRMTGQDSSRLHFFNEAVTDDGSNLVFYSVSDRATTELGSTLPYWWDQLGSFDRTHITKHLDGILEPFIVETKVLTVSLSTFIDREKIEQIDVLHIDAEGHDFRVLKSLDLSKSRPRLILIEHKHLSLDDRVDLLAFLNGGGYRIREFQSDLMATSGQ